MAGKKAQRIAELEAEVRRLKRELRLEQMAAEVNRKTIAQLSQRPPSLVERAKRKWNDWCDDMMRAVGL